MAVKFVSKVQEEVTPALTTEFTPMKVDIYVEAKAAHDKAASALKKLKTAVDNAAPALQQFADANATATSEITIQGLDHCVLLGPKAKVVSEVNLDTVIKIMGMAGFLKIAKVGITDLREYLNEDQLKTVLTEANTGPRRIKVIE